MRLAASSCLGRQVPVHATPCRSSELISSLMHTVHSFADNLPMFCTVAGDLPSWVALFSAAAVVFYTILDCLDGKQARRTGTSSPLGQLFDHGCDALSVNLLLANIACSLSIGCGWAHALGNLGVSLSSRTCGRQ